MNMPKAIDLTGQRFGRLVVTKRVGNKGKHRSWECLCDCGNITIVPVGHLRSGNTRSCGCLVENNGQNVKEIVEKFNHTNPNFLKSKLAINNKSGVKGVCWQKRSGKWVAHMGFRGKKYTLGTFADINDAIAARKAAEEKYFKPVLEEYENQNEGVENE